MLNLHRIPLLILLLLLVLLPFCVSAQPGYNAYSFDMKYYNKPLHFGILLGYNRADFRIHQSELFQFDDTIRTVESTKRPGFHLGIISNLRLNRNFDLRVLPTMNYAERTLEYGTWHDTIISQSIESIYIEMPVLLKYKSRPYQDMRMYVIGGFKYSYDLASNAKARNAEDIVKIGRHDLQLEYGLGVEFYFPMFILAPEIRISQGIWDVHSLDPHLQYSNVLQRLLSRMITVTFNFEG